MIAACRSICDSIDACDGYTLDSSLDIHSGLCILYSDPIRIVPSCFSQVGVSENVSSCGELLMPRIPMKNCDICYFLEHAVLTSLTFQWVSDQDDVVEIEGANSHFNGYVAARSTITIYPDKESDGVLGYVSNLTIFGLQSYN